jgi:hypothetical protein
MDRESSTTPEMDALVIETLRGERALSYAPGTFAFVAATVLTLMGSSFGMSVTIIFSLRERFPEWPWAMLLGVTINALAIVAQGLLVRAGLRIAYNAFVWFVRAWVLLTAAALSAAFLGWWQADPKAYAASCAVLVLAHVVVRSVSCRMHVTFRERFRALQKQTAKDKSSAPAR